MTTEVQVQGLGQFVNFEFTLQHVGDDELLLLHEGELVGRFYQIGATPESLQAECANHLVMKHGWNGCLWEAGRQLTGKEQNG